MHRANAPSTLTLPVPLMFATSAVAVDAVGLRELAAFGTPAGAIRSCPAVVPGYCRSGPEERRTHSNDRFGAHNFGMPTESNDPLAVTASAVETGPVDAGAFIPAFRGGFAHQTETIRDLTTEAGWLRDVSDERSGWILPGILV